MIMMTKNANAKPSFGVTFLVIALLILAPFLLIFLTIYGLIERTYWRIWIRYNWFSDGKRVFFIYQKTDEDAKYIETKLLPKLGDKAVVMDWAQRGAWEKGERKQPPTKIFEAWGKSFPMALVFLKPFQIKKFNFYRDFNNTEKDFFEYLAGIK
jgi:hypothetical protein